MLESSKACAEVSCGDLLWPLGIDAVKNLSAILRGYALSALLQMFVLPARLIRRQERAAVGGTETLGRRCILKSDEAEAVGMSSNCMAVASPVQVC